MYIEIIDGNKGRKYLVHATSLRIRPLKCITVEMLGRINKKKL